MPLSSSTLRSISQSSLRRLDHFLRIKPNPYISSVAKRSFSNNVQEENANFVKMYCLITGGPGALYGGAKGIELASKESGIGFVFCLPILLLGGVMAGGFAGITSPLWYPLTR